MNDHPSDPEGPERPTGVSRHSVPLALDTASALKRLGGNAEMLRRLLDAFFRTHASAPAAIRDALSRNDTSTGQRLTEALKAESGNLSLVEVTRVASALHDALHARDTRLALPLVDSLESALNNAQKAAQALGAGNV